MKVSVIIATYRRGEPLRRAIASVKNQTHPDIEIIVVDDNADCEWNRIARDVVHSFEGVTYIKNDQNCGPAKTRNIGIFAASGEYITFLDDDDEYLPDKITEQLGVMMAENSDFSLTDLVLYNEDGSLNSSRKREYITSMATEDLLRYHLKYHLTGTDTMMYKAEYLRNIGGFTEIDVGDEYYLMLKAIEAKGKFSYLHRCDVKAYVHLSDSVSNGDGKIAGENALFEFKKKYFTALSPLDIRYIHMRHHTVLAFVYLKQRKAGKMFAEAAKGFIASPINMLKLLKQRG